MKPTAPIFRGLLNIGGLVDDNNGNRCRVERPRCLVHPATGVISHLVRFLVMLRHEKERVSFYNRFAGNAIGFTVSFIFPGRLGEFVRPLYLAQKEGMKKGFVMGTIVVERIFDIFTMCFLLGLFILSKPLYAPFFKIDEEAYSRLSFWGIVGVAFATLLLLVCVR